MNFTRAAIAAAIVFSGVLGLSTGPASAQSWRGASALANSEAGHVQQVQYRRWHHRRHHYRSGRDWGPALGGFAAGAVIGGALAAQQAQGSQDWIAYCSAKYRSFDPASGTYLGYDGERHYCR